MSRPGKTWSVGIGDDLAHDIEGVAEIEVHENGTLVLMDAAGAWLAAFAPGAWHTVLPLEAE
jgi:hypothetical protein